MNRNYASIILATGLLGACALPQKTGKPQQSGYEQDRRAILSMAGDYDVSFLFTETVALRPGYEPKKPYRTGAHEFVQVIEDSGNRISLQQVLVEDGNVTKHWRQDWEYQQTRSWRYIGDSTWERLDLDPAKVRGTWTQTVWQVDDSPRYGGIGRWDHSRGVSTWTSDTSWRPLPRREHTTRSDYDVLVGVNRQTITPWGWSHEQDNTKLDRKAAPGQQEIVRETGLDLYKRVQGYDFKAGHDYWSKTSSYWKTVRAQWSELFATHRRIQLRDKVDDQTLFEAMFQQANDLGGRPRGEAELRKASSETLARFLILDAEAVATASSTP